MLQKGVDFGAGNEQLGFKFNEMENFQSEVVEPIEFVNKNKKGLPQGGTNSAKAKAIIPKGRGKNGSSNLKSKIV